MKQYSHFNRFTCKDAINAIESSSQGQFRNQLLLRVLNLYLVARFYEELAEILRVKEKASIFELSTFFVCTCMKYLMLFISNTFFFRFSIVFGYKVCISNLGGSSGWFINH